ncbi:hypothetical protein A9978_19020 [Pseudomonas sp. UMC65]|nr:hypothetical protein [Pseudomonas sp. UMC65]
MSFLLVALDHMARTHRTYQWIDGRIQDVGFMHGIEVKEARAPDRRDDRRRPTIGIQTGLLVFTLSSVMLVFAGGALAFAIFALYSILFG